ncbi:unnamed protein product [Miscanthus lutarioriparius]|uniref:protein-serine/threonine phosphatase n=1 Tax=Miscanthus lutarioriparius TaxID=422564 RepID=A0A811P6B6_9POAL|nr:unnamed protein product [Miscanthus lutarioriparius]
MALLSPRVPRLPPSTFTFAAAAGARCFGRAARCQATAAGGVAAAGPPSSELEAIQWGSAKLQGVRDEMEDEILLRPGSLLDGFSFAAVLDGHAGFSAVQFLRHLANLLFSTKINKILPLNEARFPAARSWRFRDELYKECAATLDGGAVLSTKNLDAITASIQRAFAAVDAKLSTWLEQADKDDDSGATATAMFLRNDVLVVSHIGDSCLVISRGGRPEALTSSHRPYGNNKTSLEEVKRIRAAGGWIVDGRICGDISVSRAFGDIRFKTRKNEMLVKGVKEGRWTDKFISRIKFKDDLIISSPDVSLVELGPDVEFVLLATDGLWDYIKSSEAVAFVRDQLRQHGDVQLACEALGQKALDQRSKDNISIVIADLGRINWKALPDERPNMFFELSQAVATVGVVSIGIWFSSFLGLQ